MGFGAGPPVSLGKADHLGPDGAALDVSHSRERVGFVKRGGEEATLPEVTAAAVEPVDGLGVLPVRPADGVLEAIRVGGDDDEVDVVGHQAPGDDADPVQGRLLGEELEIEVAVVVGEEDVLAVVASPVLGLGDVVGESREDDASGTSHGWRAVRRKGRPPDAAGGGRQDTTAGRK